MIIAQIATTSHRAAIIGKAIKSLERQVDEVRVIYNGLYSGGSGYWHYWPAIENAKYIHPVGAGWRSDGWKFYNTDKGDPDDIILICDDDIEYPPDFAQVMVNVIEANKKNAVYTVMGKNFNTPIKSFYKNEANCFKTFENNTFDSIVQIPGTCGMAYKRSVCPDLNHKFFRSMNSDIWMGIYCKLNNITPVVIRHRGDWLKNLMPLLPENTPSVFDQFKDNDKHMTDLINQYF